MPDPHPSPVRAEGRRPGLGPRRPEGSRGPACPAPTHPGPEPVRVFDAHLHCPAESGELWQWHTVTRNFDEFVACLDKTGVERGIINSERSQHRGGGPTDFVAGNREVARFVETNGRFVGACVVNPQFVDEALKEVEYCRKQLGFLTEEHKAKVLARDLEALLARIAV